MVMFYRDAAIKTGWSAALWLHSSFERCADIKKQRFSHQVRSSGSLLLAWRFVGVGRLCRQPATVPRRRRLCPCEPGLPSTGSAAQAQGERTCSSSGVVWSCQEAQLWSPRLHPEVSWGCVTLAVIWAFIVSSRYWISHLSHLTLTACSSSFPLKGEEGASCLVTPHLRLRRGKQYYAHGKNSCCWDPGIPSGYPQQRAWLCLSCLLVLLVLNRKPPQPLA